MKILQIHNRYQFRGGEDTVVRAEKAMLERRGHTVIQYLRHNDEIGTFSLFKKAGLFVGTAWSFKSFRKIRALIQTHRPDLAHIHNTLPLVSPAVFYACKTQGVPVVQTLHNFRLICPNALLFRSGRICTECTDQSLWSALSHACYRDSRVQTAALVLMLIIHRRLGTWQRKVDAYIALSPFMKETLVRAGLPGDRIFVKPNFSPDILESSDAQGTHEPMPPHPGQAPSPLPGCGALYLGRLSPEKGVNTLVRAWEQVPDLPLTIAGTGPLAEELMAHVRDKKLDQVRLPGHVSGPALTGLIRESRMLIHASECYEAFPLSIVEAFAAGLPVVASALGAGGSLVLDHRTGLHFRPGDAADLAAKVRWLASRPEAIRQMGQAARQTYESLYTETANYDQLMAVYAEAGRNATRKH